MKVLTEEQITDAVLYQSDMNGSFSEAIAFAREIEAMTLREVFKRIQPEEKSDGNVRDG